MAIDKKKKAKADKLAGDLVRSRGYCELAGLDKIACSQQLQWMHIITRGNLRLRWDIEHNAFCGCSGHHAHYTFNPWNFVELVRTKFPQKYKYIEDHRNEYFDGDIDRVIEELSNGNNG